MGWFGNLLGALIPGLVGGGQSAPPALDASLTPPVTPDPIPPAPPPRGMADRLRANGQGFMADFVDGAQDIAIKGALGPLSARVDGMARKAFNDSAYPGTTPWEQLGAGNTQGAGFQELAMKSEELAQRERESQRAAATQLGASRLEAGKVLASVYLQNGSPEAAERILRATGVLVDPGNAFDPGLMAGGKIASEIERNAAGSGLARAQTKTEDELRLPRWDQITSDAIRTSADTNLKEAQTALVDWQTKLAPIETAIRGASAASSILQYIPISKVMTFFKARMSSKGATPSSVRSGVSSDLAGAGVPEGDIFQLMEEIYPLLSGPPKALPGPPKALPGPPKLLPPPR